MVSKPQRIAIVVGLIGVAAGLSIFVAMAFLRSSPPTVNFAEGHTKGQPVNMTLQTVGAIGYGVHPTWVSYLTQTPDGKWVHTTLWDLPANTQVNVTLYQYDSGSPLRNQVYGQVTGTQGGTISVNGKTTSLVDSNSGNGVGHTFAIPSLGINVPLEGVSSDAQNPCNAAPCTTNFDHNTIKFSFTTPASGDYPWQCFLPCGLGYLYGTGGPMQTVGYMDGFLKVVA